MKRNGLTVVFLLLLSSTSRAAIIAETAFNGAQNAGNPAPGTLTVVVPASASATRAQYDLIVGVLLRSNTATVNLATSTYKSVANLTQLALATGTSTRAYLLRAPASATGGNLVINISANVDMVVGAVVYSGIHQTLPTVATNTGSGNTDPSVTVAATATTQIVVDATATHGDFGGGTIGGGQTQTFGRLTGTGNGDLLGIGSMEQGINGNVTMSYNLTNNNEWSMAVAVLRPASTTEARMIEQGAVGDGKRARVTWRTGFEADNLGWRVHRDRRGKDIGMVAGSALTAVGTGRSYVFTDDAPGREYWLEEIDLHGGTKWHGPIRVEHSSSKLTIERSPRLEDVAPRTSTRVHRIGPQCATLPRALRMKTQQRLASGALGPAWKIAVRQTGWYRVEAADLAGVDPATLDPRLFRLYADGQEVAIRTDGHAIEFFGIPNDTPWEDRRIYWLAAGTDAGSRISAAAAAPNARQVAQHRATVELRERAVYFAALLNGDDDNFFGRAVAADPVNVTVPLSASEPSGSAAKLEVTLQGATAGTLQGATAGTHRVQIAVNGWSAGEMTLEGRQRATATFEVAASLLRDGDNQVRLTRVSAEVDVALVDTVRLSYDRQPAVIDGSLHVNVEGPARIPAAGFGGAAQAFDVTDPLGPLALQISAAGVVEVPGRGARSVWIASNPLRAASIVLDTPSSMTRGDLWMIGRRDLIAAASALRDARTQQGWTVASIDIEDVFDEMSFGAKTPYAIRDLLARLRPRAALLVGDASFDPRNYLGLGGHERDAVPTKLVETALLETASDDWLADFDGDDVADVQLGRIPAHTPAEVSAMIDKILRWSGSGTTVAVDHNDAENDFESAAARLGSSVLLRRTLGDTGLRNAVERTFDANGIIHLVGHGSVEIWAGGLLSSAWASSLRNVGAPIVVGLTCLNAFFHDLYSNTLGEALVRSPAGAAAVWTSSGLTELPPQVELGEAFNRALANGESVGAAVRAAKMSVIDRDVRRTWILLGDPTMTP